MRYSSRSFMLILAVVVVIVVLASAVGPSPAFADDETPPAPSAEETAGGEISEGAPPETPGDEGAPAEGQPPAGEELAAPAEEQPPAEEPAAPAEEQPFIEEPAAPAEEQPPAEEPAAPAEEQPFIEEPAAPAEEPSPAEEPVTAAEILEQLPEGTELVVINESGEVEPLATVAAAEIIATGDPMWCPAGVAPGGGGCTASQPDFASLIALLAADAMGANAYNGNGTIWVEAGAGNDNSPIVFDGGTLTNINGSNLTIQGGWDGILDGMGTITGTSLAKVSIAFENWSGDLTIKDFKIQAADGSGFGLQVVTDGAVTLDNVSVSVTGTTGDGALIFSTGAVNLSNSQFDNNDGYGLQVTSAGDIALNNVSASDNSGTGALLDTCQYNGVTCQGTGSVTVNNYSAFSNNVYGDGLVIDSGGSTSLQHVNANGNGSDGAFIENGVAGGAGNVQISDSNFLNNANATGLEVYQYSNGSTTLNKVTATGNIMGAILDTTGTTGSVTVSNSQFSSNDETGLYVESGGNVSLASVVANNNDGYGMQVTSDGNIALNSVSASGNSGTGALLDTCQYDGVTCQETGSVTVNNSTFSTNDLNGLSIVSGGSASLQNVNANDNGLNGAFIVAGGGGVQISGSNFQTNADSGLEVYYSNGLTTLDNVIATGNANGLQVTSDGDIALNNVSASDNSGTGAWLDTCQYDGVTCQGTGSVTVSNNSTFSNNGFDGLDIDSGGSASLQNVNANGNGIDGAFIYSNGSTSLQNVNANGNGLNGAFLVSGSGNIFVNNSTFQLNTETGLLVVTNGLINLLDVTADQNGVNGAEFYSLYAWSCAGNPSSTIVSVDGGTFTNNGGYGLLARPGPDGNLVFGNNPTTFGGNGLGNFLLDLTFTNCSGGSDHNPSNNNPSTPKDPVIVQVTDHVEPMLQDCANTSGTIWQTPDGVWVKIGCLFEGYSLVQSLTQDGLPGPLGAGTDFETGVTVSLTDEDGNIVTVNPDGTIIMRFPLPASGRGHSYSILFWDPTLNDGAGGWVQLPPFEAGTSFPLHPEDPDDQRLIIAGVQEKDGALTVTVNFPGIFVLVSR